MRSRICEVSQAARLWLSDGNWLDAARERTSLDPSSTQLRPKRQVLYATGPQIQRGWLAAGKMASFHPRSRHTYFAETWARWWAVLLEEGSITECSEAVLATAPPLASCILSYAISMLLRCDDREATEELHHISKPASSGSCNGSYLHLLGRAQTANYLLTVD